MKRNIKFKAKRLDNGEWVKGSLVKTPFGTFIEWYEDSICNKREVNPDTVCQFTGLKDNSGNEIWEGDIVEFEIYDLCKGRVKTKAVVEYISSEYVAVTDGTHYSLSTKCIKCIKVVGNKFDKKE